MMKTNRGVLDESTRVQDETSAAISRIQRQLVDTQAVGTATAAKLEEQRTTLSRTEAEADHISDSLDETEKLQNRFGKWSWNRSGRKSRREAEEESKRAQRDKKTLNEGGKALSSNLTKQSPSYESAQQHRTRASGGVRTKEPVRSVSRESKGSKLSHEKESNLGTINQRDTNEIDGGLDILDQQLSALLTVSNDIGNEAKAQSSVIDRVQTKIDGNEEKTRVVTHRTRRFLGLSRHKQEKK